MRYEQSISTPRLNTLRCVHLEPINVVVFHGLLFASCDANDTSSWGRLRA